MTLGTEQWATLRRLLVSTPWADIFNALLGVEIVLGLLLEATHEDFLLWEREADDAGYPDEFGVTDADFEAMPDDLRRGWVARLIRNLAFDFGIETEFSGRLGGLRNDRDALAPLLHQLCDIASNPRPQTALAVSVECLGRSLELFTDAPEMQKPWYLMKAEREAERLLADIRARAESHGSARR